MAVSELRARPRPRGLDHRRSIQFRRAGAVVCWSAVYGALGLVLWGGLAGLH